MTVSELIGRLQAFPQDAMVYVPTNENGQNDTVRFVAHMPHLNLPHGIAISPDVALLPGDMERFVTDSEDATDREGDV